MQQTRRRGLIGVASVGAVLGAVAVTQAGLSGHDDRLTSVAESVTTPGTMTYYEFTGTPGACGSDVIDATTEDLVALPASMWTTPNPNNDPLCQMSVEVTLNGKTITVPVRDKCADCEPGHIDLSRAAFQKLGDTAAGHYDVTWKLIGGDDSGDGGTSGSGTADTQAPTAPATVTRAGWTDSSVALTWDASTDDVGVTGYDLFVDGKKIFTTPTNRVVVTNLTKGTTYKFTVAAVDAAGNVSAQSPPSEVKLTDGKSYGSVESQSGGTTDVDGTAGDAAPGKPGTPTRTGWTADTVGLTWDDSKDDKGTTGYYLYLDGAKIADTLVHRVVIKGLTKGTAYKFSVQGHDMAGNVSPLSDPIEVTLTGDSSGSVDPFGGKTADLTNTGANGTAGPTGGPTATATATSGPDACGIAWSGSQGYVPGDFVSYQGHKYKATFYANGAVPGDPTSWAVWHDEGACA